MASIDNLPSGTLLSPTNVSYTALAATLVLLLAVSSAIVIRSLILRRRHQRLVEEAIRAGSWLPHHMDSISGRRRRDWSQKPRLWETWLHPDDDHDDEHEFEKVKWNDIMPVYAEYVNEPALSPQGSTPDSAENSVVPSSRPSRLLRPFTRRRSSPSPHPTPASPMASQTVSLPSSSPSTTATPAVRVAVLIAMPGLSQKHGGDDSGPPAVEIGTIEARVKDDQTVAPSAPSYDDS